MVKRLKMNPKAIRQTLDAQKDRASKKITIEEHPLLRVDKEGKHSFRATWYPHCEDPAAEPFPVRWHHFGIDGTGIVYCPQKNEGKECHLCDFVWERMKETAKTDAAKEWAKKLPKPRVWIPGKVRGREDEGVKFLTFGTREDRMSPNHQEVYDWFEDERTQDYLDPDDGIDMIVKYQKYSETQSRMFGGAKYGLQKEGALTLDRDASPFGDDWEDFMDSIPDIDDSDIPGLKNYSKKTTEDTLEALKTWTRKLGEKVPPEARVRDSEEADTDSVEVEEEAPKEKKSARRGNMRARLLRENIKVEDV